MVDAREIVMYISLEKPESPGSGYRSCVLLSRGYSLMCSKALSTREGIGYHLPLKERFYHPYKRMVYYPVAELRSMNQAFFWLAHNKFSERSRFPRMPDQFIMSRNQVLFSARIVCKNLRLLPFLVSCYKLGTIDVVDVYYPGPQISVCFWNFFSF